MKDGVDSVVNYRVAASIGDGSKFIFAGQPGISARTGLGSH
jgi:hypothetical protein